MRYSTGSRAGISFSGAFPPGVKWLLLANAAVFVVYFLGFDTAFGRIFDVLKLYPRMVVRGAFWQPVTYLFLHGDLWHLFFNMVGLYMFGAVLERTWGTHRFLQYYFLTGAGAGVCVVLADLLSGAPNIPTIGASGAIFGVLLAFGILFPDSPIWIWFLFPIKAKYFVLIFGAIEFLYLVKAPGSGVSHVAHLGGMLFGIFYLRSRIRTPDLAGAVARHYREWKLKRARRRFEVYLQKRDRDRDPWVH
jgi:membrane associated rhomboid family serine protease